MLPTVPTGNAFLDSLAPQTLARLLPMLQRSQLRHGHVIAQPGSVLQEAFFPIGSVISVLTQMADGSAVEVGLVGRDGMSGAAVVFGDRASAHMTVVQITGDAYCTGIDTLVEQMSGDAHLRARVLAYAGYAFFAATQFAACNRLHPLEERYARWTLMADDRAGPQAFVLTQEFSAQMLGVRRAGVTVAAGIMSSAGLIAYHRGRISVLDRPGLEEVACECYGVVNAEQLRLLGYTIRQPPVDPAPPLNGLTPAGIR